MYKNGLVLLLLCLCWGLFSPELSQAQDNPFLRRSPKASTELAPDVSTNASPAPEASVKTLPQEQSPANTAWEEPGLALQLKAWFQTKQYELNQMLSEKTLEAKAGNAPGVWIFLMLVAFVYGAFHSIGPGHGKCVVCSYFVSEEASLRRGLTLGYLVAAIHAFSAFSIVAIIYYALKGSGQMVLNDAARYTSWVGYSLIILLGSYLLVRNLIRLRRSRVSGEAAVLREHEQVQSPVSVPSYAHAHSHASDHRHAHEGHSHLPAHSHAHEHGHAHHHGESCASSSCDHEHHHHASDNRNLFWVAAAIGFVPCPGALTILLFSISLDFLALGVVLALMIALGMGLTISLLAMGTILSRKGALNWFSRSHNAQQTQTLEYTLGLLGSGATVMIGTFLLWVSL